MGKESITLSMELAVTSSNVLRIIIHWLSARRDVGLTQGSLKEHSLYRALKHSIRQHKLDLNLSKTKQPLPIITNSHLNFRYLTASTNFVNTELEIRPSSHLTKHSTPARERKLRPRFRRRPFQEPNLIRIKADPNYLDRLNWVQLN